MTTNQPERREKIRYSEAFKQSVVREVKMSGLAFSAVARKYDNGARGKIIRVEKPNEINQLKQLQQRVRLLEGTVGTLHVELALERAYTEIACERAGIADVAEFKKKRRGSRASSRKCGGGGGRGGVPTSGNEPPELLCAAPAAAKTGGGRGVDHRTGAGGAAGVEVGRDRFREVLRQGGLLLAPLPKEYPTTTHAYHSLPVFTNLVKGLVLSEPHEAWVSDLTYLRMEEGFLYLSLVTDKYSRKIVGYHCGDTLAASGCVKWWRKEWICTTPAGRTRLWTLQHPPPSIARRREPHGRTDRRRPFFRRCAASRLNPTPKTTPHPQQ
jgi:hypothetical protein